MNMTPARSTRPILFFAVSLVLLSPLLTGGCQRRPKSPDLVVFATGNLWGQLQTCG